jgi:hypothetical protein
MKYKPQFLSFLAIVLLTSTLYSMTPEQRKANNIVWSFSQGRMFEVFQDISDLKIEVAQNDESAIRVLKAASIKIQAETTSIYFNITLNVLAAGAAFCFLYKDAFDDQAPIYKSSLISPRLIAWYSIYNSVNSFMNLCSAQKQFNANKVAVIQEITNMLENTKQ